MIDLTPWSSYRVKYNLEDRMRIGELSRRAGCSVETVRFYEREGLLPKPERGSNNYRLYGQAHLETLCFIRNCRFLEMTLEEIGALLRLKSEPGGDCSGVNTILEDHIEHVVKRIRQLETLKEYLISLRTSCQRVQPRKSCTILQELAEQPDADSGGDKASPHVAGPNCGGRSAASR